MQSARAPVGPVHATDQQPLALKQITEETGTVSIDADCISQTPLLDARHVRDKAQGRKLKLNDTAPGKFLGDQRRADLLETTRQRRRHFRQRNSILAELENIRSRACRRIFKFGRTPAPFTDKAFQRTSHSYDDNTFDDYVNPALPISIPSCAPAAWATILPASGAR